MRCLVRVLFVAFAATSLAGCGTSGGGWDGVNSLTDSLSDAMHDFNPLGTSKKPLPGERRAVFPEGVPGVQQGVPNDMIRHNQPMPQTAAAPPPPPGSQADDEAAPAPPPAAAPKATKTVRRARSTTAIEQPRRADPPADDEVWPPLPQR
jgi:hypothetical protein